MSDDDGERLCFQVNWMRREPLKLISGELTPVQRRSICPQTLFLSVGSVSLMMSAITSYPRARPPNLQRTRTDTGSGTETARTTARAAGTPILRNHEEMNTRSVSFLCFHGPNLVNNNLSFSLSVCSSLQVMEVDTGKAFMGYSPQTLANKQI